MGAFGGFSDWKSRGLIIECISALCLVFLRCNPQILDEDLHTEGNLNMMNEQREKFDFQRIRGVQEGLFIRNINGAVRIAGIGESDEVTITGWKIVRARTAEDAKSHIGDIKINVDESSRELNITTNHPVSGSGVDYRVDYDIQIPELWSITADIKNGDIRVSRPRNTLIIILSNGTIDAEDVVASVRANVTNGKVRVKQNLPERGSCSLSVINGTIDLLLEKNASAELRARVTTGLVFVEDLSFTAKTSTHHEFSGKLKDGKGRVNLSATNGVINIKGF
ncbi:MAG: DUF4097 family beta strand repeat protein [Bacteroidetes bacterium]|nr:DUF4097 family beta strand repeat protein [Bacteroidota bacterium]